MRPGQVWLAMGMLFSELNYQAQTLAGIWRRRCQAGLVEKRPIVFLADADFTVDTSCDFTLTPLGRTCSSRGSRRGCWWGRLPPAPTRWWSQPGSSLEATGRARHTVMSQSCWDTPRFSTWSLWNQSNGFNFGRPLEINEFHSWFDTFIQLFNVRKHQIFTFVSNKT